MRPETYDELRVADEESRRLAQTVFDRPLVIEAGAGTGKTNTLTSRIVAWCMGPGWTRAEERGEIQANEFDRIATGVLNRVVAITFTEAAASEMAVRVGEAFSLIERGMVPRGLLVETLPQSINTRRTRARAYLGALDHLFVRTIHAFCLRKLSEAPLEAGVHPYFTVDTEGFMREEVVREVVERHLYTAYGTPGDPHLLALAVIGIGPQEVLDALWRLTEAAARVNALEEDPFAEERKKALHSELVGCMEAFWKGGGKRLHDAVRKSPTTVETLECLSATQDQVDSAIVEDGRAGIVELCESIGSIWSEKTLKRLKKWGVADFNMAEQMALGEEQDVLSLRTAALYRLIAHLKRMDPEMLDHARLALAPLLSESYRELRARGVQTFSGLLRGARDLLAGNPHIAERVRRNTDQILVDEFQDTDPLQCDVIRMIALQGPIAERPGLFVVGDPKQSIYGWRDADLLAYDAFVEEVRREGGERHRLSVNFRSSPAILDEVDRTIKPVMHCKRGLQPEFQPLVACEERKNSPGFSQEPWAPVEYWVSWAWDEEKEVLSPRCTAEEAVELEARALVRDIVALHRDQGVAWRDIGVLLRSTGDLDTYLTAFRHEGVPYAVTRDRSYFRRREIIEASALIRCVLDPNDQLALLSLLRSALVGVPDGALIPLWSRGFPDMASELVAPSHDGMRRIQAVVREAKAAMPEGIPGIERIAGWEENLIWALEVLSALRESFERDPHDVFVERLRTSLLLDATEAARYLGVFRLANLDRFFGILQEAMEARGNDSQTILRSLRKSISEAREAEEGRPKEAAENAVQVMTVHRAKGLDFEHVYLMQMHKGFGGESLQGTRIDLHEGRYEYALFGFPSLGFHGLEARREAVAAAEMIRSLYVAMTRAKERLVLAGKWPWPATRKTLERARTFMDLLQFRSSEPPPLMDLAEEIVEGAEQGRRDWGDALWLFPSITASDDGTTQTELREPELPSQERAYRDSAMLKDRRDLALARMERPFRGDASEESHEALRALHYDRSDSIAESSPMTPVQQAGISDEARRQAMAIGSAVHRALELLDLNEPRTVALKRQRVCLNQYLNPILQDQEMQAALERCLELMGRLGEGDLMARLFSLREQVIARELHCILPPPSDNGGPVGYVVGSIDLLYFDSVKDEYVVVDYKTDHIGSESELEEKVKAYTAQGDVYRRAVQEALDLPQEPRFELWFLHIDRAVVVPPTENRT